MEIADIILVLIHGLSLISMILLVKEGKEKVKREFARKERANDNL